MKRQQWIRGFLRLSALISLLSIPGMSHATIVGPGDLIRADFDMSASTPTPPYDILGWAIGVGSSNPFEFGESVDLAFFDEEGQPPFISQTFTMTGSSTLGFGSGFSIPGVLTDGIGFIEITNIVGTLDFLRLTVQGINDEGGGNLVRTDPILSDLTIHVAVPEPGTVSLVLLGLIGLGFMRRIRG